MLLLNLKICHVINVIDVWPMPLTLTFTPPPWPSSPCRPWSDTSYWWTCAGLSPWIPPPMSWGSRRSRRLSSFPCQTPRPAWRQTQPRCRCFRCRGPPAGGTARWCCGRCCQWSGRTAWTPKDSAPRFRPCQTRGTWCQPRSHSAGTPSSAWWELPVYADDARTTAGTWRRCPGLRLDHPSE